MDPVYDCKGFQIMLVKFFFFSSSYVMNIACIEVVFFLSYFSFR